MVFGLIKHIYHYFVPETLVANPVFNSEQQANLIQGYVPIYGANGRIEGYMRPSTDISRGFGPPLNLRTQSQLPSATSTMNEILYMHTSDGSFIPVTNTPSTPNIPLPAEPKAHVPNPHSSGKGAWDGWPDGNFHRDFNWDEYKQSDDLKIHWANKAIGGDRTGDEHASTWEKGKKATRRCLGVITCDNDNCNIVIRPKTNPKAIYEQLNQPCVCTAQVHHQTCEVRAFSYKWSKGVHFYNNGVHAHHRPGRVLHLLNEERERFETLVKAHPNTGPLGLIVGVPGLTGPGESVADISNVFLNADRVKKERQKIKYDTDSGGDNFIAAFAKFTEEYPGFVIYSTLGMITVISVQTKFMQLNLFKEFMLDGPVNGTVNDAAHGWWKERNSLLMITSAYSPLLFRWVPGVISYTNGASAEHFKYHFIAVFQSIAREADERKIPLDDAIFAGMMDFSEAERSGFILGYIEFWTLRPEDKRTPITLREVAEGLLKGCQEHYRAGVTRISRMTGVIGEGKADAFKARALGLLDADSSEAFVQQALHLVRDFPKLKSWMEWWTRPSHAAMLFKTERKMDINVWESIPDTNNAEESMNWKFYAACGRNHSFLEGLRSIFAVAAYYQRLFDAESKGVPILYGAHEPWKVIASNIGRTKPGRASRPEDKNRKKNDGRPPDTKDELLHPSKNTNTVSKFGPPSYPWDANSCWLDTSLELLFVSVMRNFDDFSSLFNSVPKNSGLYALYTTLNSRRLINHDEDDRIVTQALKKHRDALRVVLKKKGAIKDLNTRQSFMAWLWHLLRGQESHCGSFPAMKYFYTWLFDLHNCTGSQAIKGAHLEIIQPRRRSEHILHANLHQVYGGSVTKYFKNRISLSRAPNKAISCWRVKDGQPLCPGKRVDLKDLILSIPVLLNLEVELDSKPRVWDFPETLYPLTETLATEDGIAYDLVGLALFSSTKDHFIARHASGDRKLIYTYDGIANGGVPTVEPKATFRTHVSGKKIKIPAGYSVYQAFYYLRGGTRAQKRFYELRIKDLDDLLNLRLVHPDPNKLPSITYQSDELVKLDKKLCRAWTNKGDAYAVEYVTNEIYHPGDIVKTKEYFDVVEEDTRQDLVPVNSLPNRPISPPSSLPNSDFSMSCRCGLSGDGNILYRQEDGEAIQCEECREWSHIACQKDGRADRLKKNEPFFCDFCDPRYLMANTTEGTTKRVSERKQMEARTMSKQPLNVRLRRGRGALARHGIFWYPVRFLLREQDGRYRVRWWRGCEFASPGIVPDTITTVNQGDIVDSLWNDRTERRKIRLGKWKHSWDIPTSEDILADPSSVPYNQHIHEALVPSEAILRQILDAPATVKSEYVPAKAWLEEKKKKIDKELVPYVGSLSLTERAQVSNWFEANISKDKKRRHVWLGRLPIAHAYTIYISTLLKADPKYAKLGNRQLIAKAWNIQFSGTPSVLQDIDVDRDCLENLEEEMFERSARAGIAGHWQWGLDSGDHQYWNPYAGSPWSWDHKDREGSDGELEHGPGYDTLPSQSVVGLCDGTLPKPRPKPRPKGSSKKQNK